MSENVFLNGEVLIDKNIGEIVGEVVVGFNIVN